MLSCLPPPCVKECGVTILARWSLLFLQLDTSAALILFQSWCLILHEIMFVISWWFYCCLQYLRNALTSNHFININLNTYFCFSYSKTNKETKQDLFSIISVFVTHVVNKPCYACSNACTSSAPPSLIERTLLPELIASGKDWESSRASWGPEALPLARFSFFRFCSSPLPLIMENWLCFNFTDDYI